MYKATPGLVPAPVAVLLTLLAALLSAPIARAEPRPTFHYTFDQPFGPYPVGLRVLQQRDLGRRFPADAPAAAPGGRPLQTLVWYPAAAPTASPMLLRDFEELVATETSFAAPSAHGPSQDFVHAFMQGTQGEQTISFRNASAVPARFPVVVYAPSRDAPNTENIELCEYLASYGYVVVSSPSIGATSRHMAVDRAGAEAQAGDILFLLRHTDTLKDADPRAAAVIGYSWGGTGALLAAARNTGIRALVALDGSFRYTPVSGVDLSRFTIPLLFFSRGDTALTTPIAQGAGPLTRWNHGDLLQIRMLAISHIQFSTLFQRSQRFQREGMQFTPKGYSLADGAQSYGWIARYTLALLNAYLKNAPAASAFLMRTPGANGVPARLMQVRFTRATAP